MSYHDCFSFEDYEGAIGCDSFVGGNKDLLLIKLGITLDTTNQSAVQAAIDAGNAFLFSNLRIGLEGASGQTAESPIANMPDRNINYERSATIRDLKVTPLNVVAWNSILDSTGAIFGAAVIHNDTQARQWKINGYITIGGDQLIIPEAVEEVQEINLTMSWKEKTMPVFETLNPIFTA